MMMKKYESLATQNLKRTQGDDENPLDQWIETISLANNQTFPISCISKALTYISIFERHHPSLINLKDCYQVLSDVTSGVATKSLNSETAYFLRQCLHKLSLKIKNDDTEEEEEFLENFKLEKLQYKRTYGKRKQPPDSPSVMNKLINSLQVPEKILKTVDH